MISEFWFRKRLTPTISTTKRAEAAKVASDIAAFLANGGRITKIETGQTGMNPMGSAKEYTAKRGAAALRAREYQGSR